MRVEFCANKFNCKRSKKSFKQNGFIELQLNKRQC